MYRLTATDRDGDAATLNVSIVVSVNPGMTELRVTNTQGGYPSGFTTGQYILFSIEFDGNVFTHDGGVGLKLKIGGQDREARLAQSYASNRNEVVFSYKVQASDWDGDGISIPRRPFRFFYDSDFGVTGRIVADGGAYHGTPAIHDIDARTKLSFSNTGYPRINDRSPSFGSTTIAAKDLREGGCGLGRRSGAAGGDLSEAGGRGRGTTT